MNKPSIPRPFADASLGLTGAPRQIRDAIEQELLSTGFASASAAELVDVLRTKVVAEIVRRRDEREETGEIAILHIRDSQDQVVFGSSYVFADDDDQIKQAKRNRLFADEIHAHMNALTFGHFERFGRSVLRELGCSTAKVTPHAGDQGIDFYGDLSVGNVVGANPAIPEIDA